MNNTILEFLISAFTEPVRDPLWKDVLFTPEFKAVYHHPLVQKLGRIKQLGPAFHLYPGAVHTRLNHCLGVYHLSYQMLISLLKKHPSCITKEGACSFLGASLLHDLGHFPYAHSLKDLTPQKHEHLGAELIRSDKTLKKLLFEAGASVESVCSIIDEEIPCDCEELIFYRRLLSGTLDPDKLDYLCRDAFFCGIPYGVQDVSYIIEKLEEHNGKPTIPHEAMSSIEHLLFSKYLMYKTVYWHKTTRVATAMIKKALKSALDEQILTISDLFFRDDEEFSRLPETIDYPPFELIEQVMNNQMFAVHLEIPLEPDNALHRALLDVRDRDSFETALCTQLKKQYPHLLAWHVIIDIPEELSFETDISVLGADGRIKPFYEADELFSEPVISGFTASMRKIRVCAPKELDRSVVQKAWEHMKFELGY